MFENIENVLASGNLGAIPTADVTANAEYEVIDIPLASGAKGAYPIFDIGGGQVEISPNISMRRSERTGLSQTISSGAVYNLLNLIRPEDLVFNDDNLVYTSEGTGLNQVIKFPYAKDKVTVAFKVRITGTIAGGSVSRDWIIEVRRPNDTILDSKVTTKVNGSNLNQESTDISSYMRGATDPFIVDGVKLFLDNVSGQTITINSIQFTTILTY